MKERAGGGDTAPGKGCSLARGGLGPCLFSLLLGLAACEALDGGADMGERWESLSTAEAKIRFHAPGLDRQRVRRLRSDNVAAKSVIEIVVWTGAAASHPKARVVYVRTWSRYYFGVKQDPREVIESDRAFDGKTVEFGAARRVDNALGTVELRRFAFDDVECVAFSEYWGHAGIRLPSASTRSLQGYYCADPRQDLPDETIAAAVRSLGVDGPAEPCGA